MSPYGSLREQKKRGWYLPTNRSIEILDEMLAALESGLTDLADDKCVLFVLRDIGLTNNNPDA